MTKTKENVILEELSYFKIIYICLSSTKKIKMSEINVFFKCQIRVYPNVNVMCDVLNQ